MKTRFLAVVLILFSGCYRISYHVNNASDRTYKIRDWNHFFIAGLAPVEESHELETLCPGSKILEVKSYVSPANVLSQFVSLGMSSGTSLEFTCSFPEDRITKSAGKLRDSLLSKLGLDGNSSQESREEGGR